MPKRKKRSEIQSSDPTVAAAKISSNGDSHPVDRERVASRAYELYVARGGRDGRDVDDWLTAERELTERDRPRE